MSVELVEVQQQEIEEIKKDGAALVAKARALVISDEPTLLLADEVAAECDRREKVARAKLEKSRATSYAAYQAVLELIHEACDPYLEAKKLLNPKIYKFRKEEKEKREAEAAAERERERKRVEDERLKQAQTLSDKGRPDLADKVIAAPITVAAPAPQPVLAAQGTTDKENWKFRVVDDSKVPREFMTPDLVKIGKVVKAMKGSTRIAGVEVFDEGTIARGKR